MSLGRRECTKVLVHDRCGDHPLPGDSISWEITVPNDGDSDLEAVITDAIPEWFDPEPTWTASTGVSGTGSLEDESFIIPPGGALILTVTAIVPEFDECLTKTFTNVAHITLDGCAGKTVIAPTVYVGSGSPEIDPAMGFCLQHLLEQTFGDPAVGAFMADQYNCGKNFLDVICDLVLSKITGSTPTPDIVKIIENTLDKEAIASLIQTGDLP